MYRITAINRISTDSSEDTTEDETNTGDASYSFKIDTNEYQREESSDPQGNVQGRYSYTNKDGQYDLSYIAGSKTGFIATGGNLASPETLPEHTSQYTPVTTHSSGYAYPYSNIQTSGDNSYSFSFDTDNYQRKESSDSAGNVEGKYSYQNEAGSHDLNYIAGADVGFVATGGSLSKPNGLESSDTQDSKDILNYGDASYSFKVDTDNLQREESSDASGNVKGRFSYQDESGQHDLSYVAGGSTGFVPTGGSLSKAPGTLLQAVQIPSHAHSAVNGIVLKSFIPLVADKEKYGYIFESKHW